MLRLAMAALAVYRLALMLACEDGPIYIFKKARRAIGQWAARGAVDDEIRLSLAELVNCPYCLGVWLAAGVTVLVRWPSKAGDLFLTWLGLAGAQAWLQGRR